MIMPCMNSISAGEVWGIVPAVDGGSRLLGVPGEPGWIIGAGFAGVSCARVGREKQSTQGSEASNAKVMFDAECDLWRRPPRLHPKCFVRLHSIDLVTVRPQPRIPRE